MAPRLRKTLVVLGYALLLLFALRMAEILMRPAIHGMADEACSRAMSEQQGDVRVWFRKLVGGRPEFDNWTSACTYTADNAAILRFGRKVDMVFIGDSITQNWQTFKPGIFTGALVNRGITGQSSAQILGRFQSDVIALKPRAVHLLAGTNDVAGTPGPSSPQNWRDTMTAMIDLARANGITVILGTLPPMKENPFDATHRSAAEIARQNAWLAQVAKEKGLILADYHAALGDGSGGFRPDLAYDVIHPSLSGYDAMHPVLERAMLEAGLQPPGNL